MLTPSPWSDPDKVKQLRELWHDGLSGQQIADRLGIKSRCSIIGKARRLGLAQRSPGNSCRSRQQIANLRRSAVGRFAKKRQKSSARKFWTDTPKHVAIRQVFEAVPVAPALEAERPMKERRHIQQLETGDCRFPIGDPQRPFPDFYFCGREAVKGLPYCAAHVRRAYVSPNADVPREREDV